MHPLDNPIWQALITTHAGFAEICSGARKFPHDVSVLAGFPEPTANNYNALAILLIPDERIGLFLQAPPDPPAPWVVVRTGPMFQMLYESGSSSSSLPGANEVRSGPEPIRLTQSDVPEMLALTKLTDPGPFG